MAMMIPNRFLRVLLTVLSLGLLSFSSQAQTLFTDVTGATLGSVPHTESPVSDVKIGTGAVWFDYDRDGDLDLYMTNRVGANRLWRNDGGGHFVEVAAQLGVADAAHDGSGVSAADYDNDGDLDLYLANSTEDVLFKNQLTETGTATFVDATATAFPGIRTPQRGASASWGDYDRDGFLDLYVTNHQPIDDTGMGAQDRLFHNNGNGTFTDVSNLLLGGDSGGGYDINLGGWGFIGFWTDYDQDGDMDIFLVNDCPFGPVGTKVFRNDGGNNPLAWNFTEVSANIGAADCRNGMGIAVGDYDRDGWFDYFYTNIGIPLLLHNVGGTFSDVTASAGLDDRSVPESGKRRVTWGTLFFDYDLDGWEDLCVAAGTLTANSSNDPQPNLLYHNNGNGASFTDVSAASGINDSGRGRTVVMGDYDNDGDPDLFLVNYGEKGILYRNDVANTTGRRWLILQLQGAGPPLSNRDGIGARIKLTLPDGTVRHWETRSGTSLGGGSDTAAYFGLNNNTSVSKVEITWPSGTLQTLNGVAANQRLTVVETGSNSGSITVTSPNGKEKWIKGNTYNVTWTDNISANVTIKLLSGRRTVVTIASSTPSNGTFSWTVPTTLDESSKYRVQVSSVDDSAITDQSDGRFTIKQSAP